MAKNTAFEEEIFSNLLKKESSEHLEDDYEVYFDGNAEEFEENPVSRPLQELMKELGMED